MPSSAEAMRAREDAKHLRWVTKELKKMAIRTSSLGDEGTQEDGHQDIFAG
jgi:hypothetical protein